MILEQIRIVILPIAELKVGEIRCRGRDCVGSTSFFGSETQDKEARLDLIGKNVSSLQRVGFAKRLRKKEE